MPINWVTNYFWPVVNQSDPPQGMPPPWSGGHSGGTHDHSQPPLPLEEAAAAAEGLSLGPSRHRRSNDIPHRDGLGVSLTNIYI